jgi:hypothetical protein
VFDISVNAQRELRLSAPFVLTADRYIAISPRNQALA